MINLRVQLLGYPTCNTCKNALKYLKNQQVDVTFRHIVEETPSVEELKDLWERSGLPLTKFFNTSGTVYKALELKNKLASMSQQEQLALLSSNGMLIKRPILISEAQVIVGFQENSYQKMCDVIKNMV